MTETITDGRRDFDFFFGTWHGAIRKLADVTDRHCTEWVEFEATCYCTPILGGLGNFETARDLLGTDKVRWAQRFSWDDAATWDDLNWTTIWTRTR